MGPRSDCLARIIYSDVSDRHSTVLDAMNQQAKASGSAWVTGIPYWDLPASRQAQTPLYYNSIMASGSDAHGLYKSSVWCPLENIFHFLDY